MFQFLQKIAKEFFDGFLSMCNIRRKVETMKITPISTNRMNQNNSVNRNNNTNFGQLFFTSPKARTSFSKAVKSCGKSYADKLAELIFASSKSRSSVIVSENGVHCFDSHGELIGRQRGSSVLEYARRGLEETVTPQKTSKTFDKLIEECPISEVPKQEGDIRSWIFE